MADEDTFQKASRAIFEAKRVIEKAEVALRFAAEITRQRGISSEEINSYLTHHLSSSERQEIDFMVNQKLKEIHDSAERAISEQQRSNSLLRCSRIKIHI